MNIIRDSRIKNGLSQKELARNSGIDARTLRKIENGEHVSDVSLAAVEKALGVSASKADLVNQHRRIIVTPKTFWCFAAAIYGPAAATIVWVMLYMPGTMFPAVGGLALSLSTPFLVGLSGYLTIPDQGNTRIDIKAELSPGEKIGNPLDSAKSWLGRDDVMIGSVEFDGSVLSFSAFTEYNFNEYASIVGKLKNFGVHATVRSA